MADDRRITRSLLKSFVQERESSSTPAKKRQKTTKIKEVKSCGTTRKDSSKKRKSQKYQRKKQSTQPGAKQNANIEKGTLYQIKRKENFSFRQAGDFGLSTVWSICLLDSGDLLITDSGNPVLKQINGDTYKIRNSLKLAKPAFSACIVNATEAVLGLSDQSILFVSLKDQLAATRTIKVDHICLGVCVIENNIYITDGACRNLFIYDMNGNMLKKVDGKDIFSWNRFIEKTDDNEAIYVTDRGEGLIKMDRNGEVLWKSSNESLIGAFGLCTDELGNVFVSGNNSKNVVQISSDGHYLGEVVTNNYHSQMLSALCFDRQKSKLFVASYGCSEISVYCFK